MNPASIVRHVPAALAAVLAAILAAATLAGCGSKSEVPTVLTSKTSTAFKIVTYDGDPYAVGHGIEFKIPSTWVDYGPEKIGSLGDTYEWAVGLPEDTEPLPSGIQISMGIPGKGTPYDNLAAGAKVVAQASPGFKFLDEGSRSIPGTDHAAYLRFERDLDLGSQTHKVEQVSLYLDMGGDVSATLRFIAPAGSWGKEFDDVYDSVTVAKAK